jgi:hypothetical protein
LSCGGLRFHSDFVLRKGPRPSGRGDPPHFTTAGCVAQQNSAQPLQDDS